MQSLHFDRVTGDEGIPAGEQLVEQNAERVDVHPGVDRAAPDLLGRHRVRSSDALPYGGEAALARRGAHELRDAEVEQLHARRVAVLHHRDVARLQIAVHHAGGVRGPQGIADGFEVAERLRRGEPAAPLDDGGEARALEQLHHEIRALVAQFAELVDVDDVRMADAVHDAGFADEPLDHFR